MIEPFGADDSTKICHHYDLKVDCKGDNIHWDNNGHMVIVVELVTTRSTEMRVTATMDTW